MKKLMKAVVILSQAVPVLKRRLTLNPSTALMSEALSHGQSRSAASAF